MSDKKKPWEERAKAIIKKYKWKGKIKIGEEKITTVTQYKQLYKRSRGSLSDANWCFFYSNTTPGGGMKDGTLYETDPIMMENMFNPDNMPV